VLGAAGADVVVDSVVDAVVDELAAAVTARCRGIGVDR
jgi:hypothetical protein